MRRGAFATALVAALLVSAGPALAADVQAHATRVGPAPASQTLQLVLPLKVDSAALQRWAMEVATPGSGHYREYMSIPALARRFGGSARASARVIRYLRSVGARDVKLDTTRLFVDATVSAGLAQRLFATPLAQFRSASASRYISPTGAIHVPSSIRGLVSGVVGLDTLAPAPPRQPKRPSHTVAHDAAQPSSVAPRTGTPAGCASGEGTGAFTPNQYLTAYDYGPLRSAGLSGQGERVALIEIDGFNDGDLRTFASCFGLDIPAINVYGVGGVHTTLPPGPEATLDVEVLDATAPDLKEMDVYESQGTAAGSIEALTSPVHNAGHVPQVISASLGLCEQQLAEEQGGPTAITTTEDALAMTGASGISFLASSGDSGSANCTGSQGQPLPVLAVSYPASSPFATAVGGTNLALNSANQIVNQVVWNDTSLQPGAAAGGGLSAAFFRPPYQKGLVGPNKRAVPDVSMLADIAPGYAVYCSNSECLSELPTAWRSVGGTSAATPLLAGGFALIDQELRMRHLQNLGFANPLLYALGRQAATRAQVFDDVTRFGNDIGPFIGAGALGCCTAGPGFDDASGWGSVNLAPFAAYALKLQPPNESVSVKSHQSPVKQKAIDVTVSCSGACRLAAAALIKIGGSKPFEVDSSSFKLKSAGSKKVAIHFGNRALGKLRAGLRAHKKITAQVFGVLLSSSGATISATAGHSLTIKS
jgi:subtilase family serine protease